jgi:hypothetical protein
MSRTIALTSAAGFVAAFVLVAQTSPAIDQTSEFGGPEDVTYAKALWTELANARLVGDDAIHSSFYPGKEPHGFVLEIFDTDLTVAEHTGRVFVKNNYGPSGVTPEEVSNAPSDHLAAVTVMFRREAGYDDDNGNWFWAKYLADGSLDKNALDQELAGRVAKGMDQGCIACHVEAPGGDYLFVTDRPD